jgi:hypothetical protein
MKGRGEGGTKHGCGKEGGGKVRVSIKDMVGGKQCLLLID